MSENNGIDSLWYFHMDHDEMSEINDESISFTIGWDRLFCD